MRGDVDKVQTRFLFNREHRDRSSSKFAIWAELFDSSCDDKNAGKEDIAAASLLRRLGRTRIATQTPSAAVLVNGPLAHGSEILRK